jgi:hypothetical protein
MVCTKPYANHRKDDIEVCDSTVLAGKVLVSSMRTQNFFNADEGSVEDQLQRQLQREVHDQRLRLRWRSVCGTAASLLPTGKITTVTAAASRAYIRIGLVQFVAATL